MAKRKNQAHRASQSPKPQRPSKATPSKAKGKPTKTPAKSEARKPAAPPSRSTTAAKPRPSSERPATTTAKSPPEVVSPAPFSLGPQLVLSLSFVRDGDEFTARMEGAGGHVTELKNRSLDQLLTLVAGELEDLLG